MPTTTRVLSESATLAALLFIALIPSCYAGLALINTGLGRARSAAHLMLSSLSVIAIAALMYFLCGSAIESYASGPAHAFTVAGKSWNWLGSARLFLRSVRFDGSAAGLVALLQVFSVGLAALIPLGSGADRWRLGACCASSALLAGWTYPLFAHWVWGGGWLAQLGANYALGRGFVDASGASCIQAVGGLTALAIAWILGPRRGKYSRNGMPAAIPGHNAVLVLFGCLLAWVGWLGLNAAGALLFAGIDAKLTALVALNTSLAACSSALAAVAITRIHFGRPDASLSANGWIGGLVASSAICAYVPPAAAVATGLIAGTLVTFSVELLELHLQVDDPGGVISVHAIAGLWGVLAVGIFGPFPAGQFTAQIVGIATLIGFLLPVSYGLNWLLDRVYPQRVAAQGESQGMDLFELGADAYPEFVIDELTTS